MKALELIELLAKHGLETEVYTTSRIDQGTSITAINHVGHDKHGNLVITYSDNLVVKTREAQAQADKDQELINARALYVRQAREAREAYTVQRNAKLARELTIARIDALRHWEDCFVTGIVDDEHRVFIAQVLAEQAKALEENNYEST
tara:strand:+ start:173 stop:616 length:444 start_codon:yes stop_codon:yes gene_type:complete